MRKLRVGSVPYMNAAPLTRWLETDEAAPFVQVVYAPPSELARQLEARALDVALVSSVERARRADVYPAARLGIGSREAVLSVRLFSKVPLPQIRTVALDTSSLTSVALTQILLARAYGVRPEYRHAAPDLDTMLVQADAALLIGDLGMTAAHPAVVETRDLGSEWHRYTGLPFVWALWLANAETPRQPLEELLQHAYQWGMAHIDALVEAESQRTGIPRQRCEHYLKSVMVYALDDAMLMGLERFLQECRHAQLVAGAV
ncbi:MAG: menaquinone biosynthetic enzyme MqnA/MqnD family protein [Fimbriimonadales bacterium]